MNYKQVIFIVMCCALAVTGSPTLVRKKRHPGTVKFAGTSGNLIKNESKEVDAVSFIDQHVSGEAFGRSGEHLPRESINQVTVLQDEDKWKTDNKVQERKTEKSKAANYGEFKFSALPKANTARSENSHSKSELYKVDPHHTTDLLGMKHKKSPNKHRSHHSDKGERQMKFDIALNKVPLTFSLSSNEVDNTKSLLPKQNSVEISNVVVKFGLDNSDTNSYLDPLPLSESFMGFNPFSHLFDRISAAEPPNFLWEPYFCPVHSPHRAVGSMGEPFKGDRPLECTCEIRGLSDNGNENEVINRNYFKNKDILDSHKQKHKGDGGDMQQKSLQILK